MDSIFTLLREQPMPVWNGEEPCQLDIQRIRKYWEDGRFTELPKHHQDWVCYRLLPSLIRFKCYPPPDELSTKSVDNSIQACD